MTYDQETAIARPCRLAIETMHPRFRRRDGKYGVVLTVNAGYE